VARRAKSPGAAGAAGGGHTELCLTRRTEGEGRAAWPQVFTGKTAQPAETLFFLCSDVDEEIKKANQSREHDNA
jgi:hypothetical protein